MSCSYSNSVCQTVICELSQDTRTTRGLLQSEQQMHLYISLLPLLINTVAAAAVGFLSWIPFESLWPAVVDNDVGSVTWESVFTVRNGNSVEAKGITWSRVMSCTWVAVIMVLDHKLSFINPKKHLSICKHFASKWYTYCMYIHWSKRQQSIEFFTNQITLN